MISLGSGALVDLNHYVIQIHPGDGLIKESRSTSLLRLHALVAGNLFSFGRVLFSYTRP